VCLTGHLMPFRAFRRERNDLYLCYVLCLLLPCFGTGFTHSGFVPMDFVPPNVDTNAALCYRSRDYGYSKRKVMIDGNPGWGTLLGPCMVASERPG